MKKSLLLTLSVGLLATGQLLAQKFLYVDSMYARSSVTRTQNVMYQANVSVLTGTPKLDTFRMDVYNPTANSSTSRPLIIFLHTGSYLPRYINQTPTGARDDSATVEFCTQMAQRGYVVAAISYRLGWNPALGTEDARKSSIINAAYKSVQDIAAAVRYFKMMTKNGNSYGIDTTKIAIGGQGTGSYAMYAYASITDQADIRIPKFYDFTKSEWMVQDSLYWGDRFGYKIPGTAGALINENHKGYTSDAAAGFAIGGCMGDSSWLKAGQIPLVSVHSVKDPFGPYKTDIVYVPGTNNPVVEVSGGYDVMRIENRLGNNSSYASKSVSFWDDISVKSRNMNEGYEGLYPIHGVANGSGPWEWWDDSATLNAKLLLGGLNQTQITTIIKNGSATNPLMSKSRALLYIDTALSFIMPRIACSMGLWNCSGGQYGTASVENIDLSDNLRVSPNPGTDQITIKHNAFNANLKSVEITDLNGRVQQSQMLNSNEARINLNLSPGMYLVKVEFDRGFGVQKLIVK